MSFQTISVQIIACTNAPFCHKWGSKACNHRANGPGHFNKSKGPKYQGHADLVSNPSLSGQGSGNGVESRSSSSPSEPTSNPELTSVLSNIQHSLQNLSVRMEKLERPPNPIASVASHVPLVLFLAQIF